MQKNGIFNVTERAMQKYRMKIRKYNQSAFTVIELLTSIFIVALLVAILSVVFNISIRAFRQADDIVDITNKAQRFTGQITSELQGAIVSPSGSQSYGPSITFDGQNQSMFFVAPYDNPSLSDEAATDVGELCEFGY